MFKKSVGYASLNRIKDKPMFFIVYENEKEKLLNLALRKGYKLTIISSEDFEIL